MGTVEIKEKEKEDKEKRQLLGEGNAYCNQPSRLENFLVTSVSLIVQKRKGHQAQKSKLGIHCEEIPLSTCGKGSLPVRLD